MRMPHPALLLASPTWEMMTKIMVQQCSPQTPHSMPTAFLTDQSSRHLRLTKPKTKLQSVNQKMTQPQLSPFIKWQLHPSSCSDLKTPGVICNSSLFHTPHLIHQTIFAGILSKYIHHRYHNYSGLATIILHQNFNHSCLTVFCVSTAPYILNALPNMRLFKC